MTDEDRKRLIASRAALELANGAVVNLGVGLPTMIADCLPPGVAVHLHSENGILGVGPSLVSGEGDRDLVNAGKQPISILPGGSFFDSAASFAMIRGGHIDVAILGALQVSETGDIANWAVPGAAQLGVGGAMDLVVGARKVIVTMLHADRRGRSRVVPTCTLPLTARQEVDTLITDLGVFQFRDGKMVLVELAPGVTIDELRERTPATFQVGPDIRPWRTAQTYSREA